MNEAVIARSQMRMRSSMGRKGKRVKCGCGSDIGSIFQGWEVDNWEGYIRLRVR